MKQNEEIVSNLAVITHLTGASNYTWVHFRDRPRLLVSKSLTYFEGLLPACVRIHKTALVNPAYIQQIKPPLRAKAPGSITMFGGDLLPVSRRRWQDVATMLQTVEPDSHLDDKLTCLPDEPPKKKDENPVDLAKRGVELPKRVLYAFMQDERKGALLANLINEKWPHYAVHFFAASTSLTEQMTRTVTTAQPMLIMLEARSVGWALLNTLEFIKTDARFRHIPTVVFIREQSGNDVEMCYAAGANSVVCQAGYGSFTEAAEQICQYWLTFAALPVD